MSKIDNIRERFQEAQTELYAGGSGSDAAFIYQDLIEQLFAKVEQLQTEFNAWRTDYDELHEHTREYTEAYCALRDERAIIIETLIRAGAPINGNKLSITTQGIIDAILGLKNKR